MSMFRSSEKSKIETARTNAGSSIRGKISAPIITDDDEFPIREPGAGIATPLGKGSMERQSMKIRSSAGSQHGSQSGLIASNGIENFPNGSTSPRPAYAHPPASIIQPSALRNSVASTTSGNIDGKHQRKKSSLGSVFRKLFGGKKRKERTQLNTTPRRSNDYRIGQHRSDTTALIGSARDPKASQKRSASMPINEFNRALRSHSIVRDDFSLESLLNMNSIQAEEQARPRRATTSRVLSNKALDSEGGTGLSPRPASTHGLDSKLINDAENDVAVGIALTSGSHPNRRSRSLGELRGVGLGNITVRPRSEEIKYWRESYDPGLLSPMSSNKAEPEEPIQLDPPGIPHHSVPQEHPQPFNFGPMGEISGMKITQAASLETRVQELEDRLARIEKAVSPLHGRTFKEQMVLQEPPRRNPARERSESVNQPRTNDSEIAIPTLPRQREVQSPPETRPEGIQQRSSSYGSRRPSTTSTQNSYAQNSYPTSFESISHPGFPPSEAMPPKTTGRPLSTTTTIRGIPLSPSPATKSTHLTVEHYNALQTMILAEQSARKNLESIVQALQQQLHSLTNTSTGGTSYPTPQSSILSDPIKLSNNRNTVSAFEQDDSSDEEGGRYAMENFQTPSEERTDFEDGIFGDVDVDVDGGDVKRSDRTLSLSRMTLGIQPSVNF